MIRTLILAQGGKFHLIPSDSSSLAIFNLQLKRFLFVLWFSVDRPFLEFKPLSGSFQANPPMCEEIIDASLQHIERLLADSQEPLR